MKEFDHTISFSSSCNGITKTFTMDGAMTLNELLDEFHLFLSAVGYGVDPVNNIIEIAPHPATGEGYPDGDGVPF